MKKEKDEILKALLSISGKSSFKHDIEVVVVSLIGRGCIPGIEKRFVNPGKCGAVRKYSDAIGIR